MKYCAGRKEKYGECKNEGGRGGLQKVCALCQGEASTFIVH